MTIDFATLNWGALLVAHVVCMVVVLIAIFVRRRWLKPIAVVAGAVAMWLPLLALLDTLGLPNPYPPPGDYRLISSKYDPKSETLYMFVDTLGRDFTPRVYGMYFDKSRYSRMEQNVDYSQVVMRLGNDGGGEYEVVYVAYEPPDLLKDGMVRGWQEPRETD
jgi:hypothetical protein